MVSKIHRIEVIMIKTANVHIQSINSGGYLHQDCLSSWSATVLRFAFRDTTPDPVEESQEWHLLYPTTIR